MSNHYDDLNEGAKKLLGEIFREDTEEMPAEYRAQMMESILRRARTETDDEEEDQDFFDLDEEGSEETSETSFVDEKKEDAEEPADDRILQLPKESKPKTGGVSRTWKTVLSLAAVFVFLIAGTMLTRGQFNRFTRPMIGGEQFITGKDPSFSMNTGEKNPDGKITVEKPSEFSVFMEDMWLFIQAAVPYLGCAAAGAVIAVCITKRRKKE